MLFRSYTSENCLFEIVDIDELGDIVSYRRYYQNTQTVYYATKEAYELKVFITERIPNAYTTGRILANGYTTENLKKNINDFFETYSEIVNPIAARDILGDWDMYGITIKEEENILPF